MLMLGLTWGEILCFGTVGSFQHVRQVAFIWVFAKTIWDGTHTKTHTRT